MSTGKRQVPSITMMTETIELFAQQPVGRSRAEPLRRRCMRSEGLHRLRAAATDNAGLFYGGGVDQLLVQLIGAAMVFVWVVVTTGILFAVMKRTVGLRVSRQAEIGGLDIFEHGQPGYVFTTADGGSELAGAVSLAKAGRGGNGAGLDQADVGA